MVPGSNRRGGDNGGEQDFPIESVVMQPGEVTDVMWASPQRIREMANRQEFVRYSYLDRILD